MPCRRGWRLLGNVDSCEQLKSFKVSFHVCAAGPWVGRIFVQLDLVCILLPIARKLGGKRWRQSLDLDTNWMVSVGDVLCGFETDWFVLSVQDRVFSIGLPLQTIGEKYCYKMAK